MSRNILCERGDTEEHSGGESYEDEHAVFFHGGSVRAPYGAYDNVSSAAKQVCIRPWGGRLGSRR